MSQTNGRSTRLFLLDDHALFREGLARLLAADEELQLIGTAGAPEDAYSSEILENVDVFLLDFDLGAHSARKYLLDLQTRGFTGKVLLVTAGLPDRDALELIRLGVAGIFHKHHAPEDLRRAIREIHAGRVLIDQRYLQQLVEAATDDGARAIRLSDREKRILRFLTEGLANKEIAGQLNVSESAVKAALQSLFSKAGVRTRSQLVRLALEHFRDQI